MERSCLVAYGLRGDSFHGFVQAVLQAFALPFVLQDLWPLPNFSPAARRQASMASTRKPHTTATFSKTRAGGCVLPPIARVETLKPPELQVLLDFPARRSADPHGDRFGFAPAFAAAFGFFAGLKPCVRDSATAFPRSRYHSMVLSIMDAASACTVLSNSFVATILFRAR